MLRSRNYVTVKALLLTQQIFLELLLYALKHWEYGSEPNEVPGFKDHNVLGVLVRHLKWHV